MISFPLSFLLLPYAAVLAFVLIMALMTVFHFIRYSETTGASFLAIFLYIAGTVYILFFTWQLLKDVDWNVPIEISTIFAQSSTAFPL